MAEPLILRPESQSRYSVSVNSQYQSTVICHFILLFIICFPLGIQAQQRDQNPVNAWQKTNQATLFGDYGTPTDPVSMIMPGTAIAAGFGTYLDNPAAMALFGASFGEFGFVTRSAEESAAYRGLNREFDGADFQNSISHAGFVHAFPVDIGRFVAGAGYTQYAGYNRVLSARARNIFSSITDFFKWPDSNYSDIAFRTYATDFGDEFQDWDESVFRIGFDNFGQFPGIGQVFTISERGYGGEYSIFAATEFRQNLMVGLSLGWNKGTYSYNRNFEEIDVLSDYNSDFIDTSGDGEPDTDIDRILLEDHLSAEFGGFRIRAGLLYRITPFINLGLSYIPSTNLKVNERLHASITSTMKNRVSFEDNLERDFTYHIKTPSKLSLGMALDRYYGFTLSMAADYVNITKTELDYRDDNMLDMQERENEELGEFFRDIWNFRAGVSYDLNPYITLRGGYAKIAGRFDTENGDRRILSFGTGMIITSRILFDLAFQRELWEEVSSVYDFIQYDYSPLPESPPDFSVRSENADRQVIRWNALGSFVILF